MHTRAHSHDHFFGMHWNPANLAVTLLLTLLFFILLLLFMTITAPPAYGQQSVPASAREAATMPQFAAKLGHAAQPQSSQIASRVAHPAEPRASYKNPWAARVRNRRGGPLDNNVLYDNGPINGTTGAWTINGGFVVSDTLTVPGGGGTPGGLTFGAWAFPGDVLQSVEVSITSSEFGGTTYFDQAVNFTQSGCSGNQYGFNICTETSSNFTGPNLAAGTYWVNLQNAVVNTGDPIYWDENSGIGCGSQGCPSEASENSVGTIPSEAFTILGGSTTTIYNYYSCPPLQNGFQEVHDFGKVPSSGLVIDTAGNLYGTLASSGRYGAGLVYGMGQRAGRWLFNWLYSFLGGSNGADPDGVIVGPGGALYGAASGGLGYGLIYKVSPPANVCTNALCSWNETTIYQFIDNQEAGIVTAFDAAGNLYGISGTGGAYGQGAVFELAPAQGGWTEKVLYSFTGGIDGGGPSSLLLGQDGNLYGTTASGGGENCVFGPASCGVVFRLMPLGGGWTETVLHAFTGAATDGWGPFGLIQDGQGALYGLSTCFDNYIRFGGCSDSYTPYLSGVIFTVGTHGGFGEVHTYESGECEEGNHAVIYHALATDAAGNLYAGEGGWDEGVCYPNECYYYCGGILQVNQDRVLVTGDADIFYNLTSDANGNLYGTTQTCGFGPSGANGMIWQYSP